MKRITFKSQVDIQQISCFQKQKQKLETNMLPRIASAPIHPPIAPCLPMQSSPITSSPIQPSPMAPCPIQSPLVELFEPMEMADEATKEMEVSNSEPEVFHKRKVSLGDLTKVFENQVFSSFFFFDGYKQLKGIYK